MGWRGRGAESLTAVMVMAAARKRLFTLAEQLHPPCGRTAPTASMMQQQYDALIGEADRFHLEQEGWLHVPALLPPKLIDAMQREVWTLLDASPDDRASWYNRPKGSFNPSRDQPGCHLLLFATQAQYDIMTHPRTYQLFRELWGVDDELWCSATGGSVLMKPPADATVPLPLGEEASDGNGDETGWGAPHRLHWDINPHEVAQGGRLRPDGGRGRWQASLAIMDAGADAGGTYVKRPSFPCAPSIHAPSASAESGSGCTGGSCHGTTTCLPGQTSHSAATLSCACAAPATCSLRTRYCRSPARRHCQCTSPP
eukprot:COSAG05_NODE_3634_length_1944_cov_2.508943_2_plen_313_part_00